MTKKLIGIDIGSTTVKAVVTDYSGENIFYSCYLRHNASQSETLLKILKEINSEFPDEKFKIAMCGSGAGTISEFIKVDFVQEVVANSIAIKKFYPETKVAIELGGQDAKVLFFSHDENTGKTITSDMRMNGSCAGGTGAFIDQISELLGIKIEEFNGYAEKGKVVYDISGRCGVFAKTDIQPLLNQGVSKEDIALSSFHAIAKQTIGGLAQGTEINPPVIFEGGPFHFNPVLVDAFIERLDLDKNSCIIPKEPEIFVSVGAALSTTVLFKDSNEKELKEVINSIEEFRKSKKYSEDSENIFFTSEEEHRKFNERHNSEEIINPDKYSGKTLNGVLGIDAGSTTSKFVIMDENGDIVYKFYSNNFGDPLNTVKKGLIEMKKFFLEKNINLNILTTGVTGYGELLFYKGFKIDYHNVETVCHSKAAMNYNPDVSFILDIGGQDMKAIKIDNGIITEIILNEACSAGCGSFIETYSKSLKIPVEKISEMAFNSKSPSRLGSRCTVFMNSSIITEQKNGKTTEDIIAGICRSIIENVFTKVVRIKNFDDLGNSVVVQGGTFKNDAVLRAFEQYTGKKVIRPKNPEMMGAIGVSFLAYENFIMNEKESSFIGLENIENFEYRKSHGNICKFCTNNCNRTVVTFPDGSYFVTGNRCEKGEVLSTDELREKIKETENIPDMVKFRNEMISKNYIDFGKPSKNITIGIPRVLEFYNSFPFWNAFFRTLGFNVIVSDKSSYKIFEKGLKYIPSDTACFPAKIVHGHIENLVEKKADIIFMPMMMEKYINEENRENEYHMCAIIQGYPAVVNINNGPFEKKNTDFQFPMFRWYNKGLRDKQLRTYLKEKFGIEGHIVEKAIENGDFSENSFRSALKTEAKKIIKDVEDKNKFAVVLAGRPYHYDELINHNLSKLFTNNGIPVITLDALDNIYEEDLSFTMPEIVNPFHTMLFAGAKIVARNRHLEMCQIVSFGCGHEAINSDEIIRILKEMANKNPLIVKLDEGDVRGPLNIRVKSFIETIKIRNSNDIFFKVKELEDPYKVKFTEADKVRDVYLPNLSVAFSKIACAVLKEKGYKVYPLKVAGKRAKELGKKYVHNDICYPAQINIGEMLEMLENKENTENIAVALAKNCEACRANQYPMLARKALDDAGFADVPIVTSTKIDQKNMHPGFSSGNWFRIGMLFGLHITDALEEMRRKIRPYELNKGETNKVFDEYIEKACDVLANESKLKVFRVLSEAVKAFNEIPIDRSKRKPRVVVTGEILMNYHPSANEYVEQYLESHGMEVIIPGLVDFFRRDNIRIINGSTRDFFDKKYLTHFIGKATDAAYQMVSNKTEDIMKQFKFYEEKKNVHELAKLVEDFVDVTYISGEGWLMAAEIISHAQKGVNSFVLVQPFACIPNHISGRGFVKEVKKRYPNIQIVSVDYDYDTSIANIQNRLQMLIVGEKENEIN